jgi:xanthine phosphoribosyltransferase
MFLCGVVEGLLQDSNCPSAANFAKSAQFSAQGENISLWQIPLSRCTILENLSSQCGGKMQLLRDRILKDGQILGNGILKVDSFVNHQVDPALMDACGREFANRFANVGATKILTAEISGIAPALTTGLHLGLPVVYARKNKPITMPDQVYLTLAPSHTKGRMVELIVSPEYLANNEKVLIIDDFLASGATILGLVRLAEAAGSQIVGIGALIEKDFEGGREALKTVGVQVESLACIASLDNIKITFVD